MRTETEILVVGAGVWGTSIAHALVRAGTTDVVVVDRFDVADGSSWAAAGFVGQVRHRLRDMELITRSAAMYAAIERDHPGAIGWNPVGSLKAARTDERVAEIRTSTEWANTHGVPTELVAGERLAEIAPMLDLSDALLAAWTPSDGSVVPERLARYLADAAVRGGAQLLPGTGVLRIEPAEDGVVVTTTAGTITARTVVLAAGLSTGLVARTAGIDLPLSARRARYLISAPLDDPSVATMPTFRDPDQRLYMRAADGRVLLGATRSAKEYRLPEDVPVERRERVPVGGDLDGAMAAAARSLPALGRAGVAYGLAAFEGATPDARFIAGRVAERLWVCAGGEGYGIAAAGGLGEAVTAAVLTGDESGLAPYSPDRFAGSARLDEAGLAALLESKPDRFAVAAVGGA